MQVENLILMQLKQTLRSNIKNKKGLATPVLYFVKEKKYDNYNWNNMYDYRHHFLYSKPFLCVKN